jgi:RNA polymerase sigma-70 factor (ECF subfamily)
MRDPGGFDFIIQHSLDCYQSLQIFTRSRYPYIRKLHGTGKFLCRKPHCFTGVSMTEFRARIEEEIPRLRRYARALTRNGSRCDDLVQDTLVRALAKEHLWQSGSNMRAWLFTIMHNQNVNSVRSAIREGMTVDFEEQASNLVATTDPTVARQLHELDRALMQVPEEQRQVILLVGLEGMSYEDAAAILDIPVGTVRSRLSRGRDALRRLMGMGERTVKPGPHSRLPKETPITAGVVAA